MYNKLDFTRHRYLLDLPTHRCLVPCLVQNFQQSVPGHVGSNASVYSRHSQGRINVIYPSFPTYNPLMWHCTMGGTEPILSKIMTPRCGQLLKTIIHLICNGVHCIVYCAFPERFLT